jgi:hypothetical protein
MSPISNYLASLGLLTLNLEYRQGNQFDWLRGAVDPCVGISELAKMPRSIIAISPVSSLSTTVGARI